MVDLTEIDAEILKFIEACETAGISSIKAKFQSTAAIEYRVKCLSTPEYFRPPNSPISFPKENTSYLIEDYETTKDESGTKSVRRLGTYRLTEIGKKKLQDYKGEKKSKQRELWLKNAWIPILVTLATNLIIGGVKWLIPLIQEWLTHTPG